MNHNDQPDWRQTLQAAIATLPEHIEIPYSATREGERLTRFKKACPPEFLERIDRTKLPNPAAFDLVANWNGLFPGPCAYGPTDGAKTRAGWSACGRLFVRENRDFKCWPVRELLAEMKRYEDEGNANEFFRYRDFSRIWFVDDVDKLNWQYESNLVFLIAFFDWVKTSKKPCISTTNHDRAWWAARMGDAFARRLFADAHFAVDFSESQKRPDPYHHDEKSLLH